MDSMPYQIGLDRVRSTRTEPHQDNDRRGMFIPDDARWTIIESRYKVDGEGFLIRTERRRLESVYHERHSQKARPLYVGTRSPNEEPGQGRWSCMERSTWNHPNHPTVEPKTQGTTSGSTLDIRGEDRQRLYQSGVSSARTVDRSREGHPIPI